MTTKSELLQCAITKFTKFGSKHVTLDELAKELGISKKTIYSFFKNKEELVIASIESLLNAYTEDINRLINSNGKDPILSVILIYQRGFEYLKYFKPSFLFGLEKYYPKAFKLFNDFSEDLCNNIVSVLLKKAQQQGDLKPETDIDLLVKIYFFRVDNLLFKDNNLFEMYSKEALLKHMVIYNLQGVVSDTYSNVYFE
ncbi:TetR/AcrR family transcriptional regulator [Psychroserpens algicola]|uniref:TetR/AcrR family transcriptional regulator n=1 Tax=Psychroserpens algicola TaxID=1719034 RepID=A0ABT0H8R6_9FLAO|nr:TetR/AcrR family transcriptional regulator [Psychroserpens algicola]MCK8480235.1 TetR/AcrR family transcriptional regulator [Psychroserpens algicola]